MPRPRALLLIDCYELTEQWIEPDPWSWVLRRPRPSHTTERRR